MKRKLKTISAKPTRRKPRGRRKFQGSKLTNLDSVSDPYRAPRPYGWAWPVGHETGNRSALLKFFLPVMKGSDEFPGTPYNFSQTADQMLGVKQLLSSDPALMKELDHYEQCEKADMTRHPYWNCPELPLDLLRRALSLCPAFVLQKYEVVQRALARLYAVAWWGRGPDSAEAKRQLEELLPRGNAHPITKYVPEVAGKFREIRRRILESDKLMRQEFPRESERVTKLAELYAEPKNVIYDALHKAKTPFLAERLAEVLGIPVETARKALQIRRTS
jgi:hypothetical protein